MSARVPVGYAELWVASSVLGDPEQTFNSIGLDIDLSVADASEILDDALVVWKNRVATYTCEDVFVGTPGTHLMVGSDGADVRVDYEGAAAEGEHTAGALPPNTALLVKKSTAAGGRRGRGRMFMVGIAEPSVNNAGVVETVYRNLWAGEMSTMLDELEAVTGIQNVVLLHGSSPFAPTTVTALTVDPLVATQRQRLRR